MKRVISIGEALIDFIPNQKGCELKNVLGFERVAGGAPANVSAVVAKLGGKSNFISKLGKDAFGNHIIEVLKEANVNVDYVLRSDKANTGLAFVSLKEDGNRDFSFYRNPSADMLLEESEVKKEWFEDCHSMHFCSVDLIECPMKYAHKKAIEFALENKSIISFDPNVRLPLWDSEDACRDAIMEFLPLAHVVKISDEELEFVTGYDNMDEAKEVLFKGNVNMVLFTKGKDGAEAYTKDRVVKIPGNIVDVVDTTGAGDSFIGSFLFKLLEDDVNMEQLNSISDEKLREYLTFANAYAAYSTTKKGAIGSYATLDEIIKYMDK
ncbi:carbohydrate kinase family protein [Terrisporobacter sp.]|uniref:carbohydrate kinase family protein n=1 Tax=Terrisporobacter sp. TaxID=1965305 RepID=UPI0025ED475D|nr:carbohydrate kinase [uncultured Terrisporobacter sp.]